MIRIVVADDQALVRGGFRLMLDQQPDIEVCGEAADGAQAVTLVREQRPDVVLMDVRMPGTDGLEATRRILSAPGTRTRVLVLTTFDLDEYVVAALRAGASGYLLKDVDPDDLVAAVRSVAAGDAALAPSVVARLVDEYVRAPRVTPPEPRLQQLSAREHEVLTLLAEGLTNREIAERLVVSPATVKTHVASLLAKLDLRDRVQAVILAYESGIVRPGARAPGSAPPSP
ncbi:response regulator transcription factor [Phycicoccus sp.]|uniref:response regulator transcription factor n=1 Tax=Phycicoccus sp. TaxID=1902410 RepID=UPI002C7D33AD|nr:response regulator transcription factor [Phycicoccus sp.]HMM93637.1 response regulator transcription factor [Phycicoccus sp.]